MNADFYYENIIFYSVSKWINGVSAEPLYYLSNVIDEP